MYLASGKLIYIEQIFKMSGLLSFKNKHLNVLLLVVLFGMLDVVEGLQMKASSTRSRILGAFIVFLVLAAIGFVLWFFWDNIMDTLGLGGDETDNVAVTKNNVATADDAWSLIKDNGNNGNAFVTNGSTNDQISEADFASPANINGSTWTISNADKELVFTIDGSITLDADNTFFDYLDKNGNGQFEKTEATSFYESATQKVV